MFRWGASAYALLSILVCAGSWAWFERLPLSHPEPWLGLREVVGHLLSLLLGTAFAAALVITSRLAVLRFGWARRLHLEFRPIARQLDTTSIVLLAALSAVGEELFFRGLLQPFVGLIPQAVLFGLLHQLRGPSRWVWVTWAGVVGLGLGVLFQLTGSLLGPVVAHALVNGFNLTYIKHHDPLASRRSLGGLLDRKPS